MCKHPYYIRDLKIQVRCGHCLDCRRQRVMEWSDRLMHELGYHKSAIFLNLTYNDDNLPDGATLNKRDPQIFMKRMRNRYMLAGDDRKLKYFYCGEYGDQGGRPHYHFIIFGVSMDDMESYRKGDKYVSKVVNNIWPIGFNTIGTVTRKSCEYVASYVNKKVYGEAGKEVYENTGRLPPFVSMSKGIGKQYALDNAEELKKQCTSRIEDGFKSIPRFYRKVLKIDAESMIEAIDSIVEVEFKEYEKETGLDPRLHANLSIRRFYQRKEKVEFCSLLGEWLTPHFLKWERDKRLRHAKDLEKLRNMYLLRKAQRRLSKYIR